MTESIYADRRPEFGVDGVGQTRACVCVNMFLACFSNASFSNPPPLQLLRFIFFAVRFEGSGIAAAVVAGAARE